MAKDNVSSTSTGAQQVPQAAPVLPTVPAPAAAAPPAVQVATPAAEVPAPAILPGVTSGSRHAVAVAASEPATFAGPAHRDERGVLTRFGMERVIAGGGSVIHNGEIITDIARLPSQADLAKGDKKAEAAARESLLRQRDALDAELAKIGR